MVLPPLPNIGDISCNAVVQIDSVIKGSPISLVDSINPKIKLLIIPFLLVSPD